MDNYLEVNHKIMEEIASIINQYPYLRFNQVLWACSLIVEENNQVVDTFNEKPVDTLIKVREAVKELKENMP